MPTLHTVTASEAGLLSNSYIVEGAQRLVVVDPPMLLSDARALAARVTAFGKPLGAVVITHAHPDHSNGATALDPAPIVALSATAHVLAETAEPKRAQWTPIFGDDYPQAIRLPDTTLASGAEYVVDELHFRVTDFGAGECASMALWTLEAPDRIVFAGDFVYPQVHGWLAEGRTREWLAQLERLGAILRPDDVLYPGHGARATIAALADQREYIEAFRDAVGRAAVGQAKPDEATAEAIAAAIRERYATYRLPSLIPLGVAGVARELANE